MKHLGIDYGAKRVGIAISDNSLAFAFPLIVLDNTKNLISDIGDLCKKHEVGVVVVGDSRDFDGHENKIMEEIAPFVENLKKDLNLQVVMHPEFLTSVEAERLQGKNEMHDASAAALMLKSYLYTSKDKYDIHR